MQFRKDINGLRAIAVIGVVLFHFNESWMPGGFAGVDVFFVISGFLMTGIIFRGINKNSFSISEFYVSRANRLIPALLALCAVVGLFSYFFLVPIEFMKVLKHIGSSLTFISNMVYWTESGYFNASSHQKWLLHTWSLSVEWQFYIVYPIVLVLLRKFLSHSACKLFLLVSTFLAFIFCLIVSQILPELSYFSLPTRAWELLIGGVACVYPFNLKKTEQMLLHFLGCFMVVMSYFYISASDIWPSYLALLPVLGTFFIIQANFNNNIFTNHHVFQKLGTWSYSIYLWHWPIVVLNVYLNINHFEYIGMLISILLGFLSYHYIEKIKIINDGFGINFFKLKVVKATFVMLFVSTVSYFTIDAQLKKSPNDLEPYILGHHYQSEQKLQRAREKQEIYLNGAKQDDFQFLVLGDSNIAHFSYGLTKNSEYRYLLSWVGSCLNFPDYTTIPYASWMDENWLMSCKENHKKIIDYPNTHVIMGHQWRARELQCVSEACSSNSDESSYSETVEQQLSKLQSMMGDNRNLYLIGQVPAPKESMVVCMKKKIFNSCQPTTDQFNGDRININAFLDSFSQKHNNVYFINPFKAVCDANNNCNTIIEGKNIFYDGGHLSAFGAAKIWPYIEGQIQQSLVGSESSKGIVTGMVQ